MEPKIQHQEITLDAAGVELAGSLAIPWRARGLVIFAHGSGSSRFSPRNRAVAARLHGSALATLLLDLLTESEERSEAFTGDLRFDVGMLAERLLGAAEWVRQASLGSVPLGYFGASTGAAAALMADALAPGRVRAIVCRGGRPDLAGDALPQVQAPTLLLVGSRDHETIALNRHAFDRLRAPADLRIIGGAGHLFEEPGMLEEVARQAALWFELHLGARRATAPAGTAAPA